EDSAPAVEDVRARAEGALRREEPLVAYDIASEGLEHHPGDVRLRQLLALALARSGSTARAQTALEALEREGHADDETLGLLARTWKDGWRHTADPHHARTMLHHAAGYYARAYAAAVTRGRPENRAWTGINAATTELLLGDDAGA